MSYEASLTGGLVGVLAEHVVVQDTTLGRRFGFVDFDTCKDAKAALKGMNGIVVRSGSKPLYVARFMSKSERQTQNADPYCYSPYLTRAVPQNMSREGRNIYVKHLAPDVDEMTLLTIFQVRCVNDTYMLVSA